MNSNLSTKYLKKRCSFLAASFFLYILSMRLKFINFEALKFLGDLWQTIIDIQIGIEMPTKSL